MYTDGFSHIIQAYGHDQVSLLDGGLNAWKEDGNPIEEGVMKLPKQVGSLSLTFISCQLKGNKINKHLLSTDIW